MADNQIEVELILDDGKAQKALVKFKDKAALEASKAGDKASMSFSQKFNAGLEKRVSAGFSNALSVAKGFIIANTVIRSVQKFNEVIRTGFQDLRDFSRGIAEVNSLLPVNQRLTEQATGSLEAFAEQFGTNATEQAKAFYQVVSAGVQGTANQLETLRVANKAAVAGLVDINSAATVLIQSTNSYAKSGLTAAQASDVLFSTVRLGVTTFGELSEFLGQTTAIAASAGVSFSELGGSIAFLTKSGITTDKAVIGLRQTIASILKPTKEAADTAKQLGIDFSAAALRAQGLGTFLNNVANATGGSAAALTRLFGNIRAFNVVNAIANGNLADFNKILNETAGSAGATASAFRTISQNLDFRIRQREAELRSFGLSVAKTFTDIFGSLFLNVTENFKGIVQAAAFVGEGIVTFIGRPFEVVINIVKAFGAFTLTVISALTTAFIAFIEAFVQVGNRFGIVSNTFAKDIKRMRQAVGGFTEVVGEDLKDSIEGIFDVSASKKAEDFTQRIQKLAGETKQATINTDELTAAVNKFREIPPVDPKIVEPVKPLTADQKKALENERISQLEANQAFAEGFNNQLDLITDKTVRSALIMNKALIDLGKAARQGLGRGIGAGFAAFGAALVKGENALDAFLKSFLQALGQMMIQQGTAFILQGLGFSVIPGLQASGGTLIAAGSALAIAGGALTAASSGGGVGGGLAAAGGGGLAPNEGVLNTTGQPSEQQSPLTAVNVNVEGNVFDREETGLEIVRILQDAFDENDVRVLT